MRRRVRAHESKSTNWSDKPFSYFLSLAILFMSFLYANLAKVSKSRSISASEKKVRI